MSESSSESEAESDIVQKPDKLTSRRANDWSPSETESEVKNYLLYYMLILRNYILHILRFYRNS